MGIVLPPEVPNRGERHTARFVLRATDLPIGDCGLECLDGGDTSETELGYDFRSDYWN